MDVEESKPGNEDVVFHILEVIEQREDEHPTGRIPDVDKAWAEFQEYYNIPEGGTPLCTPAKLSLTTVLRIRPSIVLVACPACVGGSNRGLLL